MRLDTNMNSMINQSLKIQRMAEDQYAALRQQMPDIASAVNTSHFLYKNVKRNCSRIACPFDNET
jgi:hypothetical protein